MILEFDVGNTRHKWRLIDAGERLLGGEFANSDTAALSELQHRLPRDIERLRLASVAVGDNSERLRSWARKNWAVDIEVAESKAKAAGVVNSYSEPGRLGVDRWLGVVAAFHHYGAACVIDCGSALTLDFVDREGSHRGGFIVPGRQLSARALQRETGKVRWCDDEADMSTALGTSTAAAVHMGIELMQTAFVKAAVDHVQQSYGNDYQLVFSGGDGEYYAQLLGGEYNAELVLDGLGHVLP